MKFTSTSTDRVLYQATEATNRTSHRVAVTLPNDTYTVSIQAVLSNGGFTAPGIVHADGGFDVPKMIIGAAPKNVTLSATKVTWNAVDGATRYEVWINFSTPGGKTEHVLSTEAFDTELTLSGTLVRRIGQYRVWVRAIRNEAGHESTGRWSAATTLDFVPAATQTASALAIVMSELATSGMLDTVA